MLHAYVTENWGLRYPILSAAMAYSGRGRLANAISEAGGFGLCHDIGCVNCWDR